MAGGFAVAIAALSICLSYLLKIHALRLEAGATLGWPWLVLTPLAYLGILLYLNAAFPGATSFLFTILVLLILNAWLTGWAVHLWRRQAVRSAFWIALAHALWVVIYAFRALMVTLGYAQADILDPGWAALLLAIAAVVTAVVSNIGYLGIALERALRARIDAAAAQARAEESQRLSEQLASLDRQRCLGTMSASLGHEINQPLAAIMAHAQIIQHGVQSAAAAISTPVQDSLQRIVDHTQRAPQLIERIRGFLRPQAAHYEPVALDRLVPDVVKLITAEARAQRVTLRPAPDMPPLKVLGDPVQLSQILLNLLRNAIEAMAESPRREIQVTLHPQNGHARLRLRDTGPGLSEEVSRRVGEPFFTTKDSGLGMGLSISRTLAEQHGGTLTLTNAEDGGALAELILPVLPANA